MSTRLTQPDNRILLFVDDQLRDMNRYVEALKGAFPTVLSFSNVNDAAEIRIEPGCTVAAVVLDVMMPTGTRYSEEETEGGLLTGIRLYEELRKRFPEAKFVILSNRSLPAVRAQVPDPGVELHAKLALLPRQLVELVTRLLSSG